MSEARSSGVTAWTDTFRKVFMHFVRLQVCTAARLSYAFAGRQDGLVAVVVNNKTTVP